MKAAAGELFCLSLHVQHHINEQAIYLDICDQYTTFESKRVAISGLCPLFKESSTDCQNGCMELRLRSHLSSLKVLCAGIDGGGSVRVPSALCGIVGLRPTVGRTSTQNCPENAFSIMSFGTHTACVADAMLVYAVIANAGTHSSFTNF